jgi:hypothetical protein
MGRLSQTSGGVVALLKCSVPVSTRAGTPNTGAEDLRPSWNQGLTRNREKPHNVSLTGPEPCRSSLSELEPTWSATHYSIAVLLVQELPPSVPGTGTANRRDLDHLDHYRPEASAGSYDKVVARER